MAGDGRVEEDAAGGHGPDRPEQVVRGRALEEVAARAGPHQRLHVGRVLVDGQHQHPGAGAFARHPLRQFEAVQAGHRDVDDRDVGCDGADHRQRLAAIGGLADELDLGVGVEQRPDAREDDRMVVGQDDADTVHAGPSRGSGGGRHRDADEQRGADARGCLQRERAVQEGQTLADARETQPRFGRRAPQGRGRA